MLSSTGLAPQVVVHDEVLQRALCQSSATMPGLSSASQDRLTRIRHNVNEPTLKQKLYRKL